MIKIIIPTRNNLEYLKIAIQTLKESTDKEFQLVVIANKCTDSTIEWLKWMCIDYVESDKNWIEAVNDEIMKSEDDIYLTQDDMNFHRCMSLDWLENISKFAQEEHVGIVTTLGSLGISDKSYFEGLKWCGTWSMYIPRKTIKSIGLLDPNMIIGNDIDYCYRVQKSGKMLGIVMNWHEHHQLKENRESYIPHGEEDYKKDAEMFRRKHGLQISN